MARWNHEKNELLKNTRNVSFEDVLTAIAKGDLICDYEHPNQNKYRGQRIMEVLINGYVHIVPYKPEPDGDVWLKTIIPSRKANKKHGG